jgi:NAD(P)-dependent dehydrogenase (short-subunit alcohol dehydrogenase family)
MSLPPQPRTVVTGAGSGLGRALCLELARRQARVLAADIDLLSAQETVRLVEQAGGQGLAVTCDVTRPEQVEELANTAEATWGGVDLVVNNAGVASAGLIGEVALEEWRRVIEVNLYGVVHGCHTFVPRFKRQGSGHVLNIASAAGLVYSANFGPYGASKAAVVALSESLACELAGTGVGVTVACPTFFRTRIVEQGYFPNERMRAATQKLLDRASLSAEGVARACLEAVEHNTLYAIPMADGRWMWRLRRLSPTAFVRLMPWLLGQAQKRSSRARGE